MKKQEKDCMFQYHNGLHSVEDTGLITRKEAEILWEGYYPDVASRLEEVRRTRIGPQMVIWVGCKTNTDYNTMDPERNIDHSDCVVHKGAIYRVIRKRVPR